METRPERPHPAIGESKHSASYRRAVAQWREAAAAWDEQHGGQQRVALKKTYGKTAWWWLLHVRDILKTYGPRDEHPPVHSYDKRSYAAVTRLTDEGTFALLREEDYTTPNNTKCTRLYYTADLDTVLRAIANGATR